MVNNDRDPFAVFDRFIVGIAAIGLVLLVVAYFGVPSIAFLNDEWRTFLRAIITNLVPTVLVFVLAYVLLYRQIQRLRSEREAESLAQSIANDLATNMRKTIVALKDMIPSAGFAWLYNGSDVLAVESETKSTEIWVVSPHLLNDAGDYDAMPGPESTVATVQKNLRKRVNYIFVVPDTDRIRPLLPRLRQNYEGRGGQLRVIKLLPSVFESLTLSEIVIYNPRMEGRNPPRVFLELPVTVAHTWWVELADEVAYTVVERIQQIVDKDAKV